MCGIAGYIRLDNKPVSPVHLKKMSDAIEHRGPDGEGQWREDNVGIAHRRLAIIDLSPAGHQPMISADFRYIIAYNGEVYNFMELRTELESKGYWFRSQTDTEVVMYAYAEWGAEAFKRFNGMFAVSIWDRQEKQLILGRDRYGIKPLYYSHQGNSFYFGSEQKAMSAHPEFSKELDHEALYEYFTFQNIFTDRTFFKNTSLLPGGCYMKLNVSTGKSQIHRYWDYEFAEPEEKRSKEEYLEELDFLFKRAVNRQLVSDVELGAYLSGGMDSGSITAIAAQSFDNLKSFTCGFDLSSASGIELAFDERTKAEAMSATFKTEHYEMVLKSGDMERCLPSLAYHLEEPRVGQSYPNYYAAKLTSKFVKVVLSGSGGDELFGGYPWRYYRGANSKSFDEYIDEYYLYWQRLVNNTELKKIFSPVESKVGGVWTRDIFKSVFDNHHKSVDSPEDYINHSLYFEAKTFLHGLFVVEDKLSMAHSLESRVPFMDNDLVDFAMKCPVGLKLNNLSEVLKIDENDPVGKKKRYFTKTNDGKQILRDVMGRIIPEDITKAQKQGFSSPDASWFKGESIDFVRRRLKNKDSILYDVMDYGSVNNIVDEHLEGKSNRRLFIWSLLNTEEWLVQNMG